MVVVEADKGREFMSSNDLAALILGKKAWNFICMKVHLTGCVFSVAAFSVAYEMRTILLFRSPRK